MRADPLDLATDHLTRVIPAVGRMGVRVVEMAAGRAATSVPLEGNANHVGTMYAGVLFAVAEVLGGVTGTATFDATRFATIVKGAQVSYLRPARSLVTARAELDAATVARVAAAAEEVGKADFVLEATVTDAEGTVVATLKGDYQLRST